MNQLPIESYQLKIDQFAIELKTAKQRHTLVSIIRLFCIIGILVSWFWVFTINPWLGSFLGSFFIILFLILLKVHKRIEEKRDFLIQLLEINQKELECCQGVFGQFEAGEQFIDTNHPYSYDMDLFGSGSIFQYLNRTVTYKGKELLANWIQNIPLDEAIILKNQKAIRELVPQLSFRQKFMAYGKVFQTKAEDENMVHRWMFLPSFFKRAKVASTILWIVPAINICILSLAIYGFIGWSAFIIAVIVNLAIVGSRLKQFNEAYLLLNKSHSSLKRMEQLLLLVESLNPECELSKELLSLLHKNQIPASRQINKLTKLIDGLDNRNNILIGILLNSLLLWDWQYLFRIEKWAQSHRADYDNWIYTIGYIDALNSLANFSFNNPDFTFPEIATGRFQLSAVEMGHPLITKKDRICNNFDLSEQTGYAIVTGANMAGKSTFLRTVGVNLILAGCGAPVCAKEFKVTPLPLYSSMRTEDSLMKHESYFYAELKRLQRMVHELEKGRKLFIVLDEILRGTNSEDKRKGSIGFVKKITEKMAYGLVATHDLELAKLAEQQPQLFTAICFEVALNNNELEFDYKLQPGVTQNMNASFLMQRMGIIE
jgi:hypothetical protein